MSLPDAVTLGTMISRLNLATPQQIHEAEFELESKNAPGEALVKILERKAVLTPWQVSKLVKGDRDGYFLGGFRLLYKISAGTFGRVFRGDNPQTGEIVAIKVLRRRWSENSQKIDLFEREGKLGLLLRHPNIVSILAVNRDQVTGQYYIVMEFVEGGNLRDILAIRKKMNAEESLRILDEAASGLNYAYSRGMTHRDIKPSNILISSQGISKLVDFGLAEITTSAGTIDGELQVDQSVDYSGLEQATSCKPGDIRSDIYFLGCVFYQMLSGKPLLSITRDVRARKQKARFDVSKQIEKDDPIFTPSLYNFLMKMVAIDPNLRFQNPQEVLDGIDVLKEENSPKSSRTSEETNSSEPRTIFVIELNEKLQNVFRTKLKEYGFRVLISIDAERAVQRYKQQPFDVILIDIGTTGEEGIEAFKRVMVESEFSKRKCTGIAILSEDQAKWKSRFPTTKNIHILVRPLSMKKINDILNPLKPISAKEKNR